jgi:hypothetical protein
MNIKWHYRPDEVYEMLVGNVGDVGGVEETS